MTYGQCTGNALTDWPAIMLEPPDPYRLRPMRLADLEVVLEIDRLSFPTPSKASLFQYELRENRLARYQVLSKAPEDQDQKIIGFAGYWMIADGAHISTIAVSPPYRRRGLGELLLLNILLMANEHSAQMATLEVRQSNQVGQALYHKYGFEIVGQRRRYYRDTSEDALLMTVAELDASYYDGLEKKRVALFERLRHGA
jgi:ribosomal-protein-alanine N-acetyltransferase